MNLKKVLATVALVATTFKAFTAGFKDIYDMKPRKRKSDALPQRRNVASKTPEGG